MIAELLAATLLVYSGSSSVSLTGFADGKMHVDFGSEIDQMSDGGSRDLLVPRLCCGESVMSPDGTIWYSNGTILVRVRHDRFRTRDTFAIPDIHVLAAGPDGSVWFKNYDRFIGHIDANGVVQRFPDPHIATSPRFGTEQIVVSNDGAAWCRTFSTVFLARVDVNGLTTIAPHYQGIELIGPARLGGVWVQRAVGKDERLDAVDHVAETLPISESWFVETNDGAIWYGGGTEIVQWKSGTITKFPLDPPASQFFRSVSQIVPESDTAVWVVTYPQFPVPSPAQTDADVAPPDDLGVHIFRVSAPAFPKRHATR